LSNLDKSVQCFGYSSYQDYLLSDNWVNFKNSYRESGKPRFCIRCGEANYQLHHLTYERICREHLDDVIPLCGKCHKQEHKQKSFLKEAPKSRNKKLKKSHFGCRVCSRVFLSRYICVCAPSPDDNKKCFMCKSSLC
jgi:hypothetical protein